MSCSRTQHSDSAGGEARTGNPSIPSLTLYQLRHWARHHSKEFGEIKRRIKTSLDNFNENITKEINHRNSVCKIGAEISKEKVNSSEKLLRNLNNIIANAQRYLLNKELNVIFYKGYN